jgi:hypothetical protein
MLKASIFELPDGLGRMSGRLAAAELANRAARSGSWQRYDRHTGRVVPANVTRVDGAFPGGTTILSIVVHVASRRVMIQYRSQVAADGDLRGSIKDVDYRVAEIRRLAQDLQLRDLPVHRAPQPHAVPIAGSVQTREGPTALSRLSSTLLRSGFLNPDEPGIQLVVVHSGKNENRASRMHTTLKGFVDGPGELNQRTMLSDRALTARRALELLKGRSCGNAAVRRANTVMLYALPAQQIDETSEDWNYLVELQKHDVPVQVIGQESPTIYALNSLLYKAWLGLRRVPYRVEHDFGVDCLVGADAAHGHDDGDSRWASVLLGLDGRILASSARVGPRDESWKSGVALQSIDEVLKCASEKGFRRVLLHRDGRQHDFDWTSLQPLAKEHRVSVEFVPVAKHVDITMFREVDGKVSAPQYGDCLLDSEGNAAWVFTAFGSRAAYNNPVYVRKPENVELAKAIKDVLATTLLQTPGLYQSTRLPATTYWADLLSKRDIKTRLKRIGLMDSPRQSTPAVATRSRQ